MTAKNKAESARERTKPGASDANALHTRLMDDSRPTPAVTAAISAQNTTGEKASGSNSILPSLEITSEPGRNHAVEAATRLLANKNLFDSLDVAHKGNKHDGKITLSDIKTFLDRVDNGYTLPSLDHTDVNALRFIEKNWSKSAVSGSNGIVEHTPGPNDVLGSLTRASLQKAVLQNQDVAGSAQTQEQKSNQTNEDRSGGSSKDTSPEFANSKLQTQDAVARLLANNILFDSLDVANEGGRQDGKVSRADLTNLIQAAENGHKPEGISAEDLYAIKFLSAQWKENEKLLTDKQDPRDQKASGSVSRSSLRIGMNVDLNGGQDQKFFDQLSQVDKSFASQYGSPAEQIQVGANKNNDSASQAVASILSAFDINRELSRSGEPTVPVVADTKPAGIDVINVQSKIMHNILAGDKDAEKIKRILSPLSPIDRAALEEAYSKTYGNAGGLRAELKGKFNANQYAELESVLNRRDGRTNDAGQAHDAILKNHPAEILETLATLNSQQIEILKQDFQKDYRISFSHALTSIDFTNAQQIFVEILSKGVDKRTADDTVTLAKLAAKEQNTDLLSLALRGDGGPQDMVKAARTKLGADREFLQLLQKPLVSDSPLLASQSTAQQATLADSVAVQDLLREGHISLVSIVTKNDHIGLAGLGGILGDDNQANVEHNLQMATDKERHMFAVGREVSQRPDLPHSDEERQALQYYRDLEKSFNHLGNAREVIGWEQTLLDPSGSIIRNLANNYGQADDFYLAAETFSSSDIQKMSDNKTRTEFTKEIENSLHRYANETEILRVMNIINNNTRSMNQSTGAGSADSIKTFLTSTATGADKGNTTTPDITESGRSIVDLINDAHNKKVFIDSYDESKIVNGILRMNEADRTAYNQNRSDFRNLVDQAVNQSLNGREEVLAKSLLQKIAKNGKEPQLDATERVLYSRINNEDSKKVLIDIQTALQDQNLRNRLKESTPLNPKEEQLQKIMNDVIVDLTKQRRDVPQDLLYVNLNRYKKTLLDDGHLSPKMQLELGLPKNNIYSQLITTNANDRTDALNSLSNAERQIAQNVINQAGKLTLADRARSYVLDSKAMSAPALESELSGLTADGKQKLKEEYASKYARDFNLDLLSKLDPKDRTHFEQLISSSPSDGRQAYYDAVQEATASRDGSVDDGTKLSLDRSTQLYASSLQNFQAKFESLPAARQAEANQLFAQALQDYKTSKTAYAERLLNIATLVGGATIGIATGGIGLPELLAVGALGGLGRIGVLKAVEGRDFDMSINNLMKEFAVGGTLAAISVTGPETLASVGGLGKAAAARVIANLGEDLVVDGGTALLKNGARDVLTKKLDSAISQAFVRGEDLSAKELHGIALKIAANPDDAASVTRIEKSITEATRQEVAASEKSLLDPSRLRSAARETAVWSGISGTGNVVNHLVIGSLNGGVRWKDVDKAFLTGAAFGGTLSIGFKVLSTTGHLIREGGFNVNKQADGTYTVQAPADETIVLTQSDGTKTVLEAGSKEIAVILDTVSIGVSDGKIADAVLNAHEPLPKLEELVSAPIPTLEQSKKLLTDLADGHLSATENSKSALEVLHESRSLGYVTGSDGKQIPVVIKAPVAEEGAEITQQFSDGVDTALAASVISNRLFGTVAQTAPREISIDGQATDIAVQEHGGITLRTAIKAWGETEYHSGASATAAKVLYDNKVLSRAFEQAAAERFILGINDIHLENLLAQFDDKAVRIKNIDFEQAFNLDVQPIWAKQRDEISQSVYSKFSGHALSSETLKKIASFLDDPKLNKEATRFGLTEEQISAMRARATWIVENGKLPYKYSLR